MERGREQIRIRGIVLPVNWDAGGNASKAAIFTANEEEYFIEEDKGSKRLFGLMQQEVEVSGTVRQEAGQNIISVAGYQRVKHG